MSIGYFDMCHWQFISSKTGKQSREKHCQCNPIGKCHGFPTNGFGLVLLTGVSPFDWSAVKGLWLIGLVESTHPVCEDNHQDNQYFVFPLTFNNLINKPKWEVTNCIPIKFISDSFWNKKLNPVWFCVLVNGVKTEKYSIRTNIDCLFFAQEWKPSWLAKTANNQNEVPVHIFQVLNCQCFHPNEYLYFFCWFLVCYCLRSPFGPNQSENTNTCNYTTRVRQTIENGVESTTTQLKNWIHRDRTCCFHILRLRLVTKFSNNWII